MFNIPTLTSDNPILDQAFRIAVGDFTGNVILWQDGLLKNPAPAIMAGLDYVKPWTRDASFNTWYAAANLAPDCAKNTLLSVLTEDKTNGLRIGGQYWDAMIWATGAWEYILHTGDMVFAKIALEAIKNSLKFFEETEFDSTDGLFRGGACFQDGIAGYPEQFSSPGLEYSGIDYWAEYFPEKRYPVGEGGPVKALSSNCLYYNAYKIVNKINGILGIQEEDEYKGCAENLKAAINKRFWVESEGRYHYLIDAGDDKVRQEGLGYAFAILFGIADDEQIQAMVDNAVVSAHGITCVEPGYERYCLKDGDVSRHSGTVWPQVNAVWVEAMASTGHFDIVFSEILGLAGKAVRDCQFYEIYHPETGEPYGGVQELDGELITWASCHRQTWCATGFVNMLYKGLFGMKFTPEGLFIKPNLPQGMKTLRLSNFKYRNAVLDIIITEESAEHFIPFDANGEIIV